MSQTMISIDEKKILFIGVYALRAALARLLAQMVARTGARMAYVAATVVCDATTIMAVTARCGGDYVCFGAQRCGARHGDISVLAVRAARDLRILLYS